MMKAKARRQTKAGGGGAGVSAATRRLKKILGKSVRLGLEERKAAGLDGSKLFCLPEAVVVPAKIGDIGKVLKLANAVEVPVTVRGAGSSLTGSAVPVRGGWVLDLSGLDKIEVDVEAGMARVGAGAVVGNIHKAVEKFGWMYPPDPASKEYSTIGGNIACNAGGMRGGKWGVTRDFVLALEGFLPTGEFVRWGVGTKKFSAGFNLRDLWIGSEGMLGVVTGAVLKLVPLPRERWTLLASFEDEGAAFGAMRKLFGRRVQPAVCEFLDRWSVGCVERWTGRTVFEGSGGKPVVLLELAGSAGDVAEEKAVVLEWAKECCGKFREAASREEAEGLWEVRRKCSKAMFQMGDAKLNEDVVVPMKSWGKFAKFLVGLRRKWKVEVPVFGHLGDGNFHVNVMYHRADAAEGRRAVGAVKELMKEVVKLGGAISGEHGVGLAKSPFLRVQYSAAEVKAMLAVKRALDPKGILNPGKIFEEFRVWEQERAQVELPWDAKGS